MSWSRVNYVLSQLYEIGIVRLISTCIRVSNFSVEKDTTDSIDQLLM